FILLCFAFFFFFQAEDGIRDRNVTGVQTCALPIYNFRKIVYDDGTIRYAYQQYDSDVENINGGITFTHIVLMDESFNVINDNIHPLAYGSITESDYGCENHDYKILADDHYILTTVTLSMAENVPGYEGKQIPVVNAIVQEQKAGEVLMQWEAIDHPELYT